MILIKVMMTIFHNMLKNKLINFKGGLYASKKIKRLLEFWESTLKDDSNYQLISENRRCIKVLQDEIDQTN